MSVAGSPEADFQPRRLKLARQRRRLTKVDLARRVGLTARRLSAFENQGVCPTVEMIEALGSVLEFPADYFFRPIRWEAAADTVSFRSFSRLTAAARDSALASVGTGFELAGCFMDRLNLPPVGLPDMRELKPADAAIALRMEWGLGLDPAPNMIHLAESRGVRVFSLMDEFANLDAISTWRDGQPFIFMTRHKSPERGRWDVAHELGHLVLHLEVTPQGRQLELEADEFAREFLLPWQGVEGRLGSWVPSMQTVRREKIWWGTSAMAYMRQLKEITSMSEWHYRSLVIEASRAGYRSSEGDIERETSKLIPKALEVLGREGFGLDMLAKELDVDRDEVVGLLFPTVLEVAGDGDCSAPVRNHLRLVE
jgi:Zn-dependent peptidase ImmA (M78 family)/DNA-binding XRE family transcriptional regulator